MATDEARPKRTKLSFKARITVLVGEEEASYVVHEGITTHHSRFFRAACSGRFKESKERVVRLPETSPELFDTYLQHMYTGHVVVQPPENDEADIAGASRYKHMAELYALGDHLDDARLRNDVVTQIIKLQQDVTNLPGPLAIETAYDQTPEGSALRRLMLYFYTFDRPVDWLKKVRSILPADFIFDLACTGTGDGTTEGLRPRDKPHCEYHERNDEVPMCPGGRLEAMLQSLNE